MGISLGIILALVAMIGWGFGDFFIQKATREHGDWEPLFVITLFGAIVLLPFVWKDIPSLFSFQDSKIWLLILGSCVLFFAALLDFEALKKGKLDVVEPVWSLEIPVSALLAFLLISETIGLYQLLLIIFLIVGLVLVSSRSNPLSRKIFLEKGVFIAVISAIFMGAANFFIGLGSRFSDALMMNWFLNVFVAVLCLGFLIYRKSLPKLYNHIKFDKGVWAGMCIFDNAAWIAFAFAMTLAPIAIAVALSDSYIIIAVLLGIYINKEYLHKHQKFGLALALLSAIILAATTA